ncbi:hypothetical protein K435DRAFT_576839, partial [Dendrothele bispora CBS 962.96]
YVAPPPTVFAVDGDNPYAAWLAARTPPKHKPTLSTLPSHLLLEVVYSTFPQEDGNHEGESKIVRQRENLYWLETSLRLVSRKMYIACMHILRSTYLSTYDSLVRAPYTSDPFPSWEVFPAIIDRNPYHTPIVSPVHRELCTLDKFIAVLAHEDFLLDSTSLHLGRSEAYKDIFDLMQPKTRLEDLVAIEGARFGVISLGRSSPPPSIASDSIPEITPIPFSCVSVSFSPRKLALVYSPSPTTKRTLVEVERSREETLEVCAKRLVTALRDW